MYVDDFIATLRSWSWENSFSYRLFLTLKEIPVDGETQTVGQLRTTSDLSHPRFLKKGSDFKKDVYEFSG